MFVCLFRALWRSLCLCLIATSVLGSGFEKAQAATPPAGKPEFVMEGGSCFQYDHSEDINQDGIFETDVYVYVGPTCSQSSESANHWHRVHGIAFEDLNANGVFELGEPEMSFAYFKLSNGGNWFVCGHAGPDSTFGIPVRLANYWLMPIAPPGYRTTTPLIQAKVSDTFRGNVSNPIGFIKDATAPLETCDQYHPAR